MKKLARMFCTALSSVACVATAAEKLVSQETMKAIYEEVKTPYKVGMVMLPEKGEKIDNPCVFRHGDEWYMIFVVFDGKGYETHLAKSADLVKWKRLGKVFGRAEGTCWDSAQADGWPALLDPRWDGPNTLNKFDGRYWMMYIGGHEKGYETDPLSTGVAWTDDPSVVKQWTRYPKNPVLSPSDADSRDFERKTIFKHYTVEDPTRAHGGRFVNLYNAKQKGVWRETIGMAVSDDMLNWRRVGDVPVISNGNPAKFAISGDPMIRRIGDVWVMFYFGCGWQRSGAFDTFACSYDLKHWTKWEGKPLIEPSEPYDATYAHKPWVIKHNGVVYHFYCAVGDKGRGIALATSSAQAGAATNTNNALPVPKNVPELMKTFAGADVKTRADWEKVRAPELLACFEREEYGKRPAAADERGRVSFETYRETEAFGGKAICRHVRVKYDGPNGKHVFPITAYIPKAGRPVPAFVYIGINFRTKYDAEGAVATSEYWPVEKIIDRGYATAAFPVIKVAADNKDAGFSQGVFPAVQPAKARGGDSWATISAWAWGASRVLDWMGTEPAIDAKHVGVVGHSRGGKTALWTGATDKRFAMACSNESGCGGAKLNHIDLPKSEHIDFMIRVLHHWFCANYRKYGGKEMEMPFDQHEMLALIAPRLLCVGSATEDHWCGQLGEWWSAKLASPAWELYGKKGLVGDTWPDPEKPQQEGSVSYHLRTGKHFLTPYDWDRYMDFADRHGWRCPVYTGPVTAQEVRVRTGVGHFMEKVKAGKEVTVAYLGGSITAMNGWRNLTTDWLRATYPQAKFKEIHASIGGTGSNLGVFRVAHDALRHNPDLLFVEFATNDSGAMPEAIWRSMEGIVRQTWKKNPDADIVFAYTITEAMKQDYLAGTCNRAASAMEQLADHYDIPSICFGPRVIDAVKAGTLVMSGKEYRNGEGKTLFAKDGVHPALAGHRLYLASVVNGFTQMKDMPPADHAAALRTPFVSDNLEAAKMVEIKPSMLVGDWKKLPPSDGKVRAFSARMGEMWYTSSPGATLRFTFRGTCCQIYDLLGPDGGQVWVTVDGKKSARPVARFDSYCTYHRIATLSVFSGEDGVHTVEITVDKDQPSRQPVAFRLKNPAVELAKPKYQGTKFWPAKIMLVGDLLDLLP